MMTFLRLKDSSEKIETTPNLILVVGDALSSNTKKAYDLFSKIDGWEIYLIDSEEDLEAYQRFRLRSTPTIFFYQNRVVVKSLSNKQLPNDIYEAQLCIQSIES